MKQVLLCLLIGLSMGDFALAQNEVSKAEWKEITRDIDYGEREIEEEEEEEEDQEEELRNDFDMSWWQAIMSFFSEPFMSALLIGLASLVLILLIIFIIIKAQKDSSLRKLKSRNLGFSLEDIEENFHETDLEKALRLALEAEDYKVAVRIYYLIIIKILSENAHIKWRKEKTNFDYVREMNLLQYRAYFSSITLSFERIWYGDSLIGEQEYNLLKPQFERFINKLKHGEQ
ncbi:MAG: hypothetical protein P8H98_08830 [Flavobacteriales bacterium]|nr:hypothetical protein [Flavobacteriales bacterium]